MGSSGFGPRRGLSVDGWPLVLASPFGPGICGICLLFLVSCHLIYSTLEAWFNHSPTQGILEDFYPKRVCLEKKDCHMNYFHLISSLKVIVFQTKEKVGHVQLSVPATPSSLLSIHGSPTYCSVNAT